MDPSPPPYSEKGTEQDAKTIWKSDADQQFPKLCIRDEVDFTRRQHINIVVRALMDRVRGRARNGFSRSEIVLLPSDQDITNVGSMINIGNKPRDVVQLEGDRDTSEFWLQPEVLIMLQQQVKDVLLADLGLPERPQEPERPCAPVVKSKWFSRKQSQDVNSQNARATPSPVTVNVAPSEICFRKETEYGLLETLRRQGIALDIHVQ